MELPIDQTLNSPVTQSLSTEDDAGGNEEFKQAMYDIGVQLPLFILSTWLTVQDNLDDVAFGLQDALDEIE